MIINTVTLQYPCTEQDVRDAHPDTGFPISLDGVDLSEFGFAWVTPVPAPAYNANTQTISEGAPVFTNDHWEQTWVVSNLPAEQIAANLTAKKAALVKQIDADADAIYRDVMGNRATEYAQAEADANAYKATGYTGTVPGYVQAWATATGKAAQWAADDILATANGWRTAQAAIRQQRLSAKEAVRNAATRAEADATYAAWLAFVSTIRGQLGV